MRRKRRQRFSLEENGFLILFFTGFAGGILLLNLLWQQEGGAVEAAGLYALGVILEGEWERGDYLWYLWKWRGCPTLLLALSGITIFGVPLALAGTLCLGAWMGGLLTWGLLTLGLRGGVLALGFLLPQFLCYVPVWLSLAHMSYKSSMKSWRSRILPVEMYEAHLGFLGKQALFFALGVGLEVWVNPWICHILLQKLKIF